MSVEVSGPVSRRTTAKVFDRSGGHASNEPGTKCRRPQYAAGAGQHNHQLNETAARWTASNHFRFALFALALFCVLGILRARGSPHPFLRERRPDAVTPTLAR